MPSSMDGATTKRSSFADGAKRSTDVFTTKRSMDLNSAGLKRSMDMTWVPSQWSNLLGSLGSSLFAPTSTGSRRTGTSSSVNGAYPVSAQLTSDLNRDGGGGSAFASTCRSSCTRDLPGHIQNPNQPCSASTLLEVLGALYCNAGQYNDSHVPGDLEPTSASSFEHTRGTRVASVHMPSAVSVLQPSAPSKQDCQVLPQGPALPSASAPQIKLGPPGLLPQLSLSVPSSSARHLPPSTMLSGSLSRSGGSNVFRSIRANSVQGLEDAVEALDPDDLDSLHVDNLNSQICAMRWLGQGGGGTVFTATWQGALVAVKFMLAESLDRIRYGALEAMVSQALLHPNVVTCYYADLLKLTASSFPGTDDPCATARSSASFLRNSNGSNRNSSGSKSNSSGSNRNSNGATCTRFSGRRASSAVRCGVEDNASDHRASLAQLLPFIPQPAVPALPPLAEASRKTAERAALAPAAVSPLQGAPLLLAARPGTPGGPAGPCATGRSAERPSARTQGAAPPAPHAPYSPLQSRHSLVTDLALDAVYHSGDGFGDPDASGGKWSIEQVLSHLAAREGMFVTMMIMEYCDRGSLLDSLRNGLFKIAPAYQHVGGASHSADSVPRPPEGTSSRSSNMSHLFRPRVVLRAVLRTARDVARGMVHLHAAGIIHGDLKPGNVLLQGSRSDRRGFVAKVADFGLSKLVTSDAPLEAYQWTTITAMSPEMIQGRCMKASDVWAFGILLWQMVTSELNPYADRSVAQILMGVGRQRLAPLWPLDTHPALLRLGGACLHQDPEQRPTFVDIDKALTSIEKAIRAELRQQQQRAKSPSAWGRPTSQPASQQRSSQGNGLRKGLEAERQQLDERNGSGGGDGRS